MTDLLAIYGDQTVLQKQVKALKEQSKRNDLEINAKLSDREKEIQILRQKDSMNTDAIATLSDQLTKVMLEIQKIKEGVAD